MPRAMADIKDDAEFGSHFLDSMLEVEMTEEDKELDVSKNYDPLETLPPIPTFDLQSETFSYKDTYRNSLSQPVLTTLPLSTSTSSNVPLVLKPSSMLIYSGNVLPPKPAPNLASTKKVSPRINSKNLGKNTDVSASVNNNTLNHETSDEKFMLEVFRPEFVENVFIKSDPPWDISLVSEEEMKYYKTCFADVRKVQNCKLHCTICDKHLGCAITAEKKINVHSMLKVLTCKPCFEFYGDGNFPCDKGDNCEIYCRWCGQGGALVCCSFCPRVFCKKCVKRNYGPVFLKSIEKASDWACFCCAQKPLWPHRAICRALLEFIAQKKTDPKSALRDRTSCCKVAGLTRKKKRDALEKGKTAVQSSSQSKVSPVTKISNQKNKLFTPLKTGKEKLLLKPIVQLKASDRVKISVNENQNSKPSGITNIFSPKSVVSGNSIIRGIATTSPAKLFSTFPSPQFIQSPVLHGETLITPPSRFLVQAKSPANPTTSFNSSFVRVALTHQAPNLDISKIPTVKIPHEVQGLVLRLIFPDNKMQYVRLTTEGTSCKEYKDFPMPRLKEKGASFVEANLAEAFKISKMMYEKLMRIRDKVTSRTKFTEESVFNSSVKKLHLAYEKTIDLLKEIDKTLIENHENWKKKTKGSVDVIDISDDETCNVKKTKPNRCSSLKEKIKKLSDDSDIEILDDILVNGKTLNNTNNKEKYRLRSFSDKGKTHLIDNGVTRKRKKSRVRRTFKRLKMAKLQCGQFHENSNGLVKELVPGTDSVDKNAASISADERADVEPTKNDAGDNVENGQKKETFISEGCEIKEKVKLERKEVDVDEVEPKTMGTHCTSPEIGTSETPVIKQEIDNFPEVKDS